MFVIFIACSLLQEKYRYIEQLSKGFVAEIGDHIYHGTVNRDGVFIPSLVIPPDPRLAYIHHGSVINLSRPPQGRRAVYELRYGRLIPGQINEKGNFVPELGGRIIAFSEYRYSIFARPIYNLPGIWLAPNEEISEDNDELPRKNVSGK